MAEWQEIATSIKPPPPPAKILPQAGQSKTPSTTQILPIVGDTPLVQPIASLPPAIRKSNGSTLSWEEEEKKVGWINWILFLIAIASFAFSCLFTFLSKPLEGGIAIVVIILIVKFVANLVSRFAKINSRRALTYTVNVLFYADVIFFTILTLCQTVKGPIFVPISLQQELINQSAADNKTVPKQLDDYTRLDSTEVVPSADGGYVFRYHITILNAGKIDADAFKNAITQQIKQGIVNNPKMESFSSRGTTYEYDYFYIDGTTLTDIVVPPRGADANPKATPPLPPGATLDVPAANSPNVRGDSVAPTDAEAQCKLGYAYDFGSGVEKNTITATNWYRKAAEQGYAPAQCRLGVHYDYGIGVDEDKTEAVKWYTKAADQGDDLAQLQLGRYYLSGSGVPKDISYGIGLLQKSADQGNPMAQLALAEAYTTGNGVPKDLSKAATLTEKAREWSVASKKKMAEIQAKIQAASETNPPPTGAVLQANPAPPPPPGATLDARLPLSHSPLRSRSPVNKS